MNHLNNHQHQQQKQHQQQQQQIKNQQKRINKKKKHQIEQQKKVEQQQQQQQIKNQPQLNKSYKKKMIKKTILDELCVKFILNCPEEHESFERLFFEIEEAHWHYSDFYCQKYKYLPKLTFKPFSEILLKHCGYYERVYDHLISFLKYKRSVPVCGVILLNKNMDKVLLVQGMKSKSWTFPRGKINEGEEKIACAIRETREETGFDCTSYLVKQGQTSIDGVFGEQSVRMFIATNVPELKFETQTRNEIAKIRWFNVNKLLNNSTMKQFWPICPFMTDLILWISNNNNKNTLNNSANTNISDSTTNSNSNNKNCNNNNSNITTTTTTNNTNISNPSFNPHQNYKSIPLSLLFQQAPSSPKKQYAYSTYQKEDGPHSPPKTPPRRTINSTTKSSPVTKASPFSKNYQSNTADSPILYHRQKSSPQDYKPAVNSFSPPKVESLNLKQLNFNDDQTKNSTNCDSMTQFSFDLGKILNDNEIAA